jgi:hypothetical protein
LAILQRRVADACAIVRSHEVLRSILCAGSRRISRQNRKECEAAYLDESDEQKYYHGRHDGELY